jgi:hypothetical protein
MYLLSCYVYTGDTEIEFEANVPLLSLGRHLRDRGWQNGIVLVFLEGFSQLAPAYRKALAGLGFECVDLEQDYQTLVRPYSNLRTLGTYEFNNLLRWVALEFLIRREHLEPTLIHMDGDILFNVSPSEIAADVNGLTFVLQGVPAFVVLGDYTWFECYRRELFSFNAARETYSAKAWEERTGTETSFHTKWAGGRDSPMLKSDQDLISHLIHTERLPQTSPLDFVPRLKFFYAQNPLYLNTFAQVPFGRTWNLNFQVRNNTAYLESMPVALWHIQTDFSDYLRLAAAFKRFRVPLRIPNPYHSRRLRSSVMPRLKSRFLPSRRDVYASVRELSTDPTRVALSLTNIFNRASFWDAAAFSNPDSPPNHQ